MIDSPDGLISLEPHQRDFVWSTEHETNMFGGVGDGKSFSGITRCIMLLDDFPGNRGLVGRKTYDQLRDTTEKEFLEFVKIRNDGTLEPGKYVRKFTQHPDTLLLQNGSEVLFRYVDDEESAVNHNLGFFWVDQLEQIEEAVYDHLLDRLRLWGNPRDPNSKAVKFFKQYGYWPAHWAMGTGNPSPGWVKRRFKTKKTLDGKPLNNFLIEAPTSANKKHLPENYEERLRETHTESWVRRFLEGSWDAFAGQVYEEFDEGLHVIEPFELPTHWIRTLGWDHGTTQSQTAVSFIASDEDGYHVIYNEYYKLSAVISEHAEAVKGMCKGDPVPRGGEDGKGIIVHIDYAIKGDTDGQGRNFGQLYAELGIIGIGANKNLQARIGRTALLLHPDPNRPFPKWHPRGEKRDKNGKLIKEAELGSPLLFVFNICKVHIHQLQIYHYPDKKNKVSGEEQNSKEIPVKFQDHMCDASSFAIMDLFLKADKPAPPKSKDPYLAMVASRMQELMNE